MAATRDRTEDLVSRPVTQYGLTCASSSDKKSFVFVKLTEQALLAIEQYVQQQQSKGPTPKPSIQFQKNGSHGAIHIPVSGSGKKFNFAVAQVEGPVRASLECIRQSKNKRTMESLGKIRYKLKVQATDEIYETTRAKMAAASNAAKQNATKVIKESGPKVGRKIRVPTGASHGKSSASAFRGHSTPIISVTAAEKSFPAKRGTRVAHSTAPSAALLSVPSPSQAYPVSNGSRSLAPSSVTNKYSSQKSDVRKSELKQPQQQPDSRTPSAGLQTNGYSDLISNWANKPTSPSVPEPVSLKAVSHNVPESSGSSSCSSSQNSVSGSPVSADDRQKLKSEFNSQYAVYKALYATLEQVSLKFWRLEEKLKNSAEGSEEWNNIMETIVKQYEELKRDEKFQETKSRVVSLHQKLAGLKRKIQSVDPTSGPQSVGDNSFTSCSRKRFRGDDITAKFDDNNNDRREKNLSGTLLAI